MPKLLKSILFIFFNNIYWTKQMIKNLKIIGASFMVYLELLLA